MCVLKRSEDQYIVKRLAHIKAELYFLAPKKYERYNNNMAVATIDYWIPNPLKEPRTNMADN